MTTRIRWRYVFVAVICVAGAVVGLRVWADRQQTEGLTADCLTLADQLGAEGDAILAESLNKRDLTPDGQLQWAKQQLERLIAQHKAEGTLPKPQAEREVLRAIVALQPLLSEREVGQIWAAAAKRKDLPTVQQRQLWIKDRMEKLVAKHMADGTLPKPKSGAP